MREPELNSSSEAYQIDLMCTDEMRYQMSGLANHQELILYTMTGKPKAWAN
jgi:hypothetical protein